MIIRNTEDINNNVPHLVGQIAVADGDLGRRRPASFRHQQFEVSDRVGQLKCRKNREKHINIREVSD